MQTIPIHSDMQMVMGNGNGNRFVLATWKTEINWNELNLVDIYWLYLSDFDRRDENKSFILLAKTVLWILVICFLQYVPKYSYVVNLLKWFQTIETMNFIHDLLRYRKTISLYARCHPPSPFYITICVSTFLSTSLSIAISLSLSLVNCNRNWWQRNTTTKSNHCSNCCQLFGATFISIQTANQSIANGRWNFATATTRPTKCT